ncbi:helix-turn-helix domain-containing protein [Klebsiella pneumoniae]|uniref:helix-turn-helix domain-containing protein n=1 Tax=Klebsiella pneumoniae TaxID=573 RepID=UPI00092DC03A|nr:helix-turn-helix domain-containing protein [Klebsiella pneumoniae]MCS5987229.1 helix-turn-helix domain-containing protein [Klebsiella pneumoniae subsp. pneumoniae]APM43851.1 hypothetical protein BB788_13220 [Klebsiella pneumoniae]EKW5385926.1 helix-turn-helix domain-containing protein [Klebsiella pneumoniae]MBE9278266.1 helix-turn-helix domain-containing protein [Klebsiella pneumoniae]MBE9295778.1 helix-turn-helix domain-containing protein [Klebsiella pneumoniae]
MTAYGTEFFSMRDVNRLRILQDVIDRNLRPGLAAEMLGITPRHCSRLLKRYRQSGPLGMNNQSRGRTGNRLLSASLTDQALNIIRKRYADFGPTLTWEKLAENHGLLMSSTYDRLQEIDQGAIVDNKRLGRTLEFIKLVQDKRDNNRSQALPAGDGPSRRRRKPTEKKSQRSLDEDDMLNALKTLQSRSDEIFGTRK